MTNSRERWGIGLGIVGVVLFGGTLPATRLAVGYLDPFFLTAMRASLAGCAGLTLLALLRRPIPPAKLWLELIATGLCTIIGFPVFMANLRFTSDLNPNSSTEFIKGDQDEIRPPPFVLAPHVTNLKGAD